MTHSMCNICTAGNAEVVEYLDHWGLIFEDALISLDSRVIPGPTIEINKGLKLKNCKADFANDCTRNACYQPVRNYILFYYHYYESLINPYSLLCWFLLFEFI